MSSENANDVENRFLKGLCKDLKCLAELIISPLETSVDCLQCGQKQTIQEMRNLQEVPKQEIMWHLTIFLRRRVMQNNLPRRGTEMVKVLGLSNYYCKLLSPLLTKYGMDKVTGKAKLLTDMNQGEIFDCSLFGDRAFLIEHEHISIPGFGRDITGSMYYLSETLKLIVAANGDEERLIPIHADGDGHCLVHAISRALVGRELFWHPLRCCLKKHFETNLEKYKDLFKDFIDIEEWDSIIGECDPEFKPPEGELHGLRNIHIFGFANVLRRPIILLDSLECMKKCGDYSALFLPGFVNPEECKGKDGVLNKPLCIAWSSHSHNHYIPLVGVKTKPLPVLPSSLVPTVWGMPQSQISLYMQFENGKCTVGGGRFLSESYIHRLVSSMEMLYCDQNKIHPSLVADAKLFLCSDNAFRSTTTSTIIARTKLAIDEGRLYRCSHCKSLCELLLQRNWFTHGGLLYNCLFQSHKEVKPNEVYILPLQGNFSIYCKYDSVMDRIVPDMNLTTLELCQWCCYNKTLYKVNYDGSVISKSNSVSSGDSIASTCDKTIAENASVRNKTQKLTFTMNWNGKHIEETIPWLDLLQPGGRGLAESVSLIASSIISKHFPGEILNVELQTTVCKEIWKLLGKSSNESIIPLKPLVLIRNKAESDALKEDSKSNCSLSDTALKDPPLEPQYVKVVTSNGQQANLNLNGKGVSYSQLQEWIKDQFQVPISNQRIKWGFPPKELQDGTLNHQLLPLKHGDRLTVEIVKKEKEDLNNENNMSNRMDFINTYIPENQRLQFQSEVLWTVLKSKNDLFEKNGTYYNQIKERKYCMHNKMHTILPEFPNKTFCYNPLCDRIELCVKSLGHFQICADLDRRIERIKSGESSVEGFSKCPQTSSLKEQKSNKNSPRTISSTSGETKNTPLLRKGPGFSVLTSPKPPDVENMDI